VDVQNQTWLRVEYEACRRQAVSAQQFTDMQADKDIYPYWVYKGMMDDRERPEHVELEGLVFLIGDDYGDSIFPPIDWNCRCTGESVDGRYLDENNLNVTSSEDAKKYLETNVGEQFAYNAAKDGMMPSTGAYFDAVSSANALDAEDFDLPEPKIHPAITDDEVEDMTDAQKKEFKNFERDKELTGADAALQEASILKVVLEKDRLVSEYLAENGNVVNTDAARPLFKDLGYNGSNAAAVHEASSVVAKGAYKELLEEGENNHVSFYAGGSGAGKTSTIDKIFPDLGKKSDAIMDGNLSNYEKAQKQIDQLLTDGKSVDVVYVYRGPEDAWNGVIHRMLHNEKEMGRLVPMSTFLKNTEGSYNTIKSLYRAGYDKLQNVKVSIMDNSLGSGKAQIMSRAKFNSITFPKNLEEKCKAITKGYYDRGEITLEQYTALLK